MPFLNESGSVTITPANVDFVKTEGGRSRLRASSHNSSGGSSAYSTNSLSSQLALQAQRRAAQRKLQMAKMMGNGNMAALMKFDRGHYSSAAESQNDAFVANRRNRSNNFSLKETFNLLKIWASPEMQWQMKHNFRNFRVWEAISYQMHEMGHERTAIQCKNRIQNLTSIYYRIKKSGQDPRTFNFPYYKIIGDVLDVKKSGSSSITPPPGVMSNGAFSMSSANVSPSSSSQNNSSGLAAHLALVAEYQDLVNGHPDGYMTPNNSMLGSSGMSVLSPEVSLSEGNSPIRMESQGRNSAAASSQKANGMRGPGSSRTVVKSDPDAVTVSVDDASGAENEEDADYNEQTYGDDEDNGTTEGYPPSTRTNKRSLSAPYATGRSTGGNPAKRPRVGSSSAASASGAAEDPIGQYLAEMVEIEREWLDMERNRAENERQMMMYMMQVLQALVCPQSQEEEESNDENGEEGGGTDFQGGDEGESEDAGGSQEEGGGGGGADGGDDGDSDGKQNE